ncbi:alpha/beta hydrolase family protein [Bradyrhizobium liaoningense]|uniref:alpha/beta hydrolase family protein n=1 Tax=Bradyrhizobium liaoningense TaxID=43992 RepID=UPI001BAC4B7B|nr:dienelactone hydrolase family protein [Bradyrhizobium liaoningense]MBR0857128.1 dienelactone hydrolase family protein [Bradyrhizobium liaoningense]
MHFFKFTLTSALCLMATLVEAAGFRFITVPAGAGHAEIQAAVWSPCLEQVGEVKLRAITLPATRNCAVTGEKLPLIVVSHGYGGYFTGHHDTAEVLADGGFVVVALDHPVDSGGSDMSRADTPTALTERPADITRVIDYMLTAWSDHAKLDPAHIGFFGFSRGGYTGLVVAGGNPDLRKMIVLCPENSPNPGCAGLRRNETPAPTFAHDRRVKALIIADPAFGPLFDPDGLKDVKIPIQLWASALSGEDRTGGEVTLDYVAAIARDLPVRPDYHLVPNAGHYAFVPPCTADLAQKRPDICTDRPGFDRAAFHAELNAGALAFFRKRLAGADQP